MPMIDRRSDRLHLFVALAGAGVLAASAVAQQPAPGVRLEGSGQHRAECDAMQLRPFDSTVWGHLTNWSGAAPTEESVKEKVVLLVTWAGWNKNTFGAVRVAEQVHKKYASEGLVTVGIHNPRDFASAAEAAGTIGITFPYAADEQGKARSALKVDGDPDFYIIDRAGNMRFADVETSSVEAAVTLLINETAEQAAAVPGAVQAAARTRMVEAARTGDTRGLVRPGEPLTVTFADPPEEAYEAANWPNFVDTTGFNEFDTLAKKLKKEKPTAELPDDGWATAKPVTRGRITVIYMFDPLNADYLSQIPLMNRAQDAWRRDVVVVGMPVPDVEKRNRLQTEEDRAKYDADIQNAAKNLVRTRDINHAIVTLPQGGLAGIDKWLSIAMSGRELGIVVMLSSDGKIRYYSNPHLEGFRPALDQMVRVDPGVQARRKAEDLKARLEGR